MGSCCPNGIFQPLIIDCCGNTRPLASNEQLRASVISTALSGDDNSVVRMDADGSLQSSNAFIDDNGRFGAAGVSSPASMFEGEGTDGTTEVRLTRVSTDTGSPRIRYRKARGTPGSEADVASGDIIGTFTFHCYRNSAYQGADSPASCMFFAEVTGTPSGNSVPGDIVFNTTDVGQTANANAMRISHEAGVFIYVSPGGTTPTVIPTNAAGLFARESNAQIFGIEEDGTVWQLTGTGLSDADGTYHLPVLTDGTRPAAGTAGRIFFNSTDGQLNIDDGTNWTLPDGTTT